MLLKQIQNFLAVLNNSVDVYIEYITIFRDQIFCCNATITVSI